MNYEQEQAVKKLWNKLIIAYDRIYLHLDPSMFAPDGATNRDEVDLKLQLGYNAATGIREVFEDVACDDDLPNSTPKCVTDYLSTVPQFLDDGFVVGNSFKYPLPWNEVEDFCNCISSYFNLLPFSYLLSRIQAKREEKEWQAVVDFLNAPDPVKLDEPKESQHEL